MKLYKIGDKLNISKKYIKNISDRLLETHLLRFEAERILMRAATANKKVWDDLENDYSDIFKRYNVSINHENHIATIVGYVSSLSEDNVESGLKKYRKRNYNENRKLLKLI
jgi:hypothetical protein